MDSRSRLDYALFQLTPTRTRCDLVICAGDCKEKLASGLLEPFIAHLKFAKDQISKGGYSITLSASASWFTKSTLERFVRFVSTPEVLERFITIEKEIANIDCSLNTNASLDSQTVYGLEEHSNKSANSAYKHEYNTSDAVHEEDSKVHLQSVLETRKAVLQKEHAMVYARALVAGFETDNLEDLISFADAFGSPRLREACLNFMGLCNTKNNDKVWMDEVAAMQAYSRSQFSEMGTSGGIIIPGADDLNQELRINVHNGNFADKKQNGAIQGSHLPQYMRTYQHGAMFPPPFQGYPPYFHGRLPWPPNAEDFRSRGKRSQTKGSQELKQDSNLSSTDSSSGSDSGNYRKSSSHKVVIRNINYITSEKDGDAEHESDNNSSNDRTVEDKPEGQMVSQQWDIFQNLLMKDAHDKESVNENNNQVGNLRSMEDLSPVKKKFEEPNIIPSGTMPEFSTKSATIRRHEGEWFLGSLPDKPIEEKSRDIFEDNFKSVESTKDVLVDDSLSVQAQSLTEPSESQLRTQDILMVSESNLTQKAPYPLKKKVEATRFNEPNDLYMVLERNTTSQQAVATWTPEMELGNSKVKITKLDGAEDKKSRSKASVDQRLERKGSTIEAKSKTLVKSFGKSKSDTVSRIKKPTGSKTTTPKGKSEKEGEKQKKMEELLTQRQKRIAERSASTVKPKTLLASRDMKKPNKPVIRSSTIDRLSAARVVNPKVLPTESKPRIKPANMSTKENGERKPRIKPANATIKENDESKPRIKPAKVVTKENGEPKPRIKPAKVVTKKNGASKPDNRPIKLTTKENGESKPRIKPAKATTKGNGESKPGNKPTKVTTKKKIADLNNVKQLPRATPVKKISNGVALIGSSTRANHPSTQSDDTKGAGKTLHKSSSSSVLQEDTPLSDSNGGSAKKASNTVSFSINEDKENPIVKMNHVIPEIEISTPPPAKTSPERSNSRKKWSNVQTSTKVLSGFRKLLSFGRS